MRDGKPRTWRKACACRVASTPEKSGMRVLRGEDYHPACAHCGKAYELVEPKAALATDAQ